jgi:hypothetical protein
LPFICYLCSNVFSKTVGPNSSRLGTRCFRPYRRLQTLRTAARRKRDYRKSTYLTAASYNKSVDFRSALAQLNQKLALPGRLQTFFRARHAVASRVHRGFGPAPPSRTDYTHSTFQRSCPGSAIPHITLKSAARGPNPAISYQVRHGYRLVFHGLGRCSCISAPASVVL